MTRAGPGLALVLALVAAPAVGTVGPVVGEAPSPPTAGRCLLPVEIPVDACDPTADPHGDLPGVGTALEDRVRGAITDGEPAREIDVLVRYDDAPSHADAARLEQAVDADVVWTFHRVPVIHARLPAAAIPEVPNLAGVDEVAWDHPVRASLDVAAPAAQALGANASGEAAPYNGRTAEAMGYTGEDVVIAVLDTGVNDDHPAFEGKWLAGASTTGETTECVNPPDDHGHGTHVAGIALGDEEGSEFRGAAPGAQLVEVKISSGPVDATSGLMRAFEWVLDYNEAIDEGEPKCGVGLDDRIDVVTVSFGSCCPEDTIDGRAALIENLTKTGVPVTISAGNSGGPEHRMSSPAIAEGSIAVANVDDRDTVDRTTDVLAGSSSRGPFNGVSRENLTDRFRKPEIGAPGTAIRAPDAQGGYQDLTGTSMATPLVAGVAAALLQAGEEARDDTGGENVMRPDGTGYDDNGSWAPGQHPVRDALALGAEYGNAGVSEEMDDKWTSPGIADRTWNNGFGYGQVNAFESLCWAFERFLAPAGASTPAALVEACPVSEASVNLDARHVRADPAQPAAGEGFVVDAEIGVAGDPSGPVTVTFRLNGETTIGQETLTDLPAEGAVSVTSDPATVDLRGWHHVQVDVDTADNVTESDESDNTRKDGFAVPVIDRQLELPQESGPGTATFELTQELAVDNEMRCPSAVGVLEIVRLNEDDQGSDLSLACGEDRSGGIYSTVFGPGSYRATWTAAGVGEFAFTIRGTPR